MVLTGLDHVDRARPAPVGMIPVDPVLVLFWIFCSALEAGGFLGGGEVRCRWYPCSQDCLSILGCSTQRLFISFSLSFLFWEIWIRGLKMKAFQPKKVYTYLNRSTTTATLVFGEIACWFFLTPCASSEYFIGISHSEADQKINEDGD